LSTFKNGGSSNSLNGVLYLLPLASLVAVVWLRRLKPRAAPALLAAAALAVVIQKLSFSPLLLLRPMTTHLKPARPSRGNFPAASIFPGTHC